MTDTPDTVRELYRQMLMRRSGAARLHMGGDMFDAARAMVRASLGGMGEDERSGDLKIHLFLRIYAPDFDPETAARIVARLRESSPAV